MVNIERKLSFRIHTRWKEDSALLTVFHLIAEKIYLTTIASFSLSVATVAKNITEYIFTILAARLAKRYSHLIINFIHPIHINVAFNINMERVSTFNAKRA